MRLPNLCFLAMVWLFVNMMETDGNYASLFCVLDDRQHGEKHMLTSIYMQSLINQGIFVDPYE